MNSILSYFLPVQPAIKRRIPASTTIFSTMAPIAHQAFTSLRLQLRIPSTVPIPAESNNRSKVITPRRPKEQPCCGEPRSPNHAQKNIRQHAQKPRPRKQFHCFSSKHDINTDSNRVAHGARRVSPSGDNPSTLRLRSGQACLPASRASNGEFRTPNPLTTPCKLFS